MQNRERSEISVEESNGSQKEQNFYFEQNSSKKQDQFYCSDEQKDHQLQPKLSTTQSLNPQTEFISQQSLGDQENHQSRSVFHNFQKHLVITLRQFVKIKKSTHKNQPESVAYQLWTNFVKQSKIYTKNILQFVFGVIDYESTHLNNVYDQQIVQKFGYSQIFSKYSDSMLGQAQQHIRKEVVQQLKQSNLKELLKKRRMGTSDQFEEYIKQFMSELEAGPMRKRLPKTRKVQMSLKKHITKQEIRQ